jgi:hypothetical protein
VLAKKAQRVEKKAREDAAAAQAASYAKIKRVDRYLDEHRRLTVALVLGLILALCILRMGCSVKKIVVDQRVDLLTVWRMRCYDLLGVNEDATSEELRPVAGANWGGAGIAGVRDVGYLGGNDEQPGDSSTAPPEESSAFLI